MPLPEITHLQFFLLTELMDGERTGRFLRERLGEEGHRKSGPAFYQLMARLEDAKFVKGRYNQKVIDGQIIKERVYSITGAGVRAIDDVRQFYVARTKLSFLGV
jgi:DNA-binding PadR family transcriptional regulator